MFFTHIVSCKIFYKLIHYLLPHTINFYKNLIQHADITEVHFSPCEKQVIRLLLEGKSIKQIADDLSLSVNTVRDYVQHIHMKTNTHDLAGLVLSLVKSGMTF